MEFSGISLGRSEETRVAGLQFERTVGSFEYNSGRARDQKGEGEEEGEMRNRASLLQLLTITSTRLDNLVLRQPQPQIVLTIRQGTGRVRAKSQTK